MIAALVLAHALHLQSASQAACAQTVLDIPARVVPVDLRRPVERSYDFGADASCIDTGEDARRVLLLRIGGSHGRFAVEIASKATRNGILPPDVRLLDRHRNEIAKYAFTEFRQRGTSYTGTIFVDGDQADATYLLVGADAASLGRKSLLIAGSRFVVVFATPLVVGAFNNGTETRREHAFAESGTISVRVIDSADRALGRNGRPVP